MIKKTGEENIVDGDVNVFRRWRRGKSVGVSNFEGKGKADI